MLIKICGLTRAADAALAEELSADYLGAIMAGGPRNVSEVEAAHVLGPPRHNVRRVAVFAPQTASEIAGITERLQLDVVQLHGDANAESVRWLRERLGCAVWPVLRVEGTSIPAAARELAEAAGALLLDARVVGQLGGTGVTLDWEGLRDGIGSLRASVPGFQLILAGGLNATNVARAFELLHPDVVDVSSGVESAPGIKHAATLAAFITAARTATQGTRHL